MVLLYMCPVVSLDHPLVFPCGCAFVPAETAGPRPGVLGTEPVGPVNPCSRVANLVCHDVSLRDRWLNGQRHYATLTTSLLRHTDDMTKSTRVQ